VKLVRKRICTKKTETNVYLQIVKGNKSKEAQHVFFLAGPLPLLRFAEVLVALLLSGASVETREGPGASKSRSSSKDWRDLLYFLCLAFFVGHSTESSASSSSGNKTGRGTLAGNGRGGRQEVFRAGLAVGTASSSSSKFRRAGILFL